jgi:hypothetical protein
MPLQYKRKRRAGERWKKKEGKKESSPNDRRATQALHKKK